MSDLLSSSSRADSTPCEWSEIQCYLKSHSTCLCWQVMQLNDTPVKFFSVYVSLVARSIIKGYGRLIMSKGGSKGTWDLFMQLNFAYSFIMRFSGSLHFKRNYQTIFLLLLMRCLSMVTEGPSWWLYRIARTSKYLIKIINIYNLLKKEWLSEIIRTFMKTIKPIPIGKWKKFIILLLQTQGLLTCMNRQINHSLICSL